MKTTRLWLTTLLFITITNLAQSVFAQDTRVVPAPPVGVSKSGLSNHVATQDPIDPERAFDSETGQNLYWDCVKKTWVDAKTGKSLGFHGVLAKDGEVVPGPPVGVSESGLSNHVATQDPIDPERAFDSETGQNLYWDRDNKTWKDAKTGKSLGFHGVLTKKPCPPPATTRTPPTPTPPPVEHASSGMPARFELGLGYSYMHPADEVVKDLHGFNVSGFYNVNSWLAFGGEFSGLYGSKTETQQFMDGDMKKDIDVKTSLDRYFYLFGPQVTVHPCEHAKVFGHVLVGGVHDRNEVSFPDGSMRSSADAFAMAVGAGVDFQVTRHFSVGPSFDYVPTHFTSPTGDNWQN